MIDGWKEVERSKTSITLFGLYESQVRKSTLFSLFFLRAGRVKNFLSAFFGGLRRVSRPNLEWSFLSNLEWSFLYVFNNSLAILNVAFGHSCFSLSVIPAKAGIQGWFFWHVRRKKKRHWILDY